VIAVIATILKEDIKT